MRFAIAAMRVPDTGHLRQDVNGGHVEEGAGREEHGDARGGERVQGLRAASGPIQAAVRGQGC